jgi:pimeloyl-ACP methyl ester carboxylesterase
MEEDVTAELPRIAAPALLLWGERDALVGRADQDAIVRGIPDATLLTYAGIGHAVHWEAPERVAADLRDFLRRI